MSSPQSPTSPSGRAFEIWSSRVQRELLALAESSEKQQTAAQDGALTESSQDAVSTESSQSSPLLPEYLRLQSHDLRMEQGFCRLTFQVMLEDILRPTSRIQEQQGDDVAESNPPLLLFVIDAPLTKVGPSGAVDASRTYPFVKPTALLLQGSQLFFKGGHHVLQDGDEIDIDCDWTPSLHLTDAAVHVALKIRETLKKGEPLGVVVSTNSSSLETVAATAKIKLTHTVQNTSHKLSSFITAIKSKASELGADIDRAIMTSSSATTPTPASPGPTSSPSPTSPATTPQLLPKTPSITQLSGCFPIDLTHEPWCTAIMYSVKALRRPLFVQQFFSDNNNNGSLKPNTHKPGASPSKPEDEDDYSYNPTYQPTNYMALQAGGVGKVAKSGIVGIGSMFKSFTQSAKNLVEESYLMLTNDHILEIKCSKFSIANATVVVAVPVSFLCKLKFRRQESISFFFKDAPEDPLIYMCPNSSEAVKHVQSILKVHGVKGKHTNAALARSIQRALDIIADIQVKEKTLEEQPTVERVQEIMDLFRQAAEIFDFADDPRHEEVVNLLHKFLARPSIASILDGTYDRKKSELESSNPDQPTSQQVASTYDEDFQKSIQEAEEMLRMAHDDLTDLDGDEFTTTGDESKDHPSASKSYADGKSNTMSELEDMLKELEGT